MKLSAKRIQSLDKAGASTTSYDHQTMPSVNKTTQVESVESTSIDPKFQPISSSTPITVSSSKRIDSQVQPITPQLVHVIGSRQSGESSVQDSKSHDTVVSVKIQWKSQIYSRILPDDLFSLGKMMCRGTYVQIARAAWQNPKVREKLISLFLKKSIRSVLVCVPRKILAFCVLQASRTFSSSL